jgi:hypothetical protein
MKSLKFFLVLVFSFAFASNVLAQRISYPNELKGFELFKSGKWKTLVPFVSTKEDVEKIFGQECLKGCDYNDNWRVGIRFVEQSWREAGKEKIPCVYEKYLGKYESISFYPKKRIRKKQLRFGKAFEIMSAEEYHSNPQIRVYYSDKYGLSYEVYGHGTNDGSYNKGDLISIQYGVSESNYPKYHNTQGFKKGEFLICHGF